MIALSFQSFGGKFSNQSTEFIFLPSLLTTALANSSSLSALPHICYKCKMADFKVRQQNSKLLLIEILTLRGLCKQQAYKVSKPDSTFIVPFIDKHTQSFCSVLGTVLGMGLQKENLGPSLDGCAHSGPLFHSHWHHLLLDCHYFSMN